ncbi:MAG TPA: nucleotidyltransferase [Candidatus Eisenbacteria bacterium]|jgi:hypothetical protein
MNRDFRDLLSAFNARGVEFLVVGAHALAFHGRVRATQDLDVWVRPEPPNARRILSALTDFGAPLQDLTVEDLTRPGLIYQIGLPPIRIDVMTSIDGVTFEAAWATRVRAEVDGLGVSVLSREHLLQNKRAVGRKQDQADVEWLEGRSG